MEVQMRTLLLISSVAVLLIALWLFVVTVVRLRSAIGKTEKLQWVEGELDRALRQLQSGDEEEILVALQMLTALNEPTARLRALPYIGELRQNTSPRVARQAAVTEERIMASLRLPSRTERSPGSGRYPLSQTGGAERTQSL
jgi:biopolymer transport protein ExbB/TolQ